MKYQSTKTYGNDRGFSCAFRQPKATHSHCSLIHGYSLGFKFVFEADHLDDKNLVYDFGNCGWIKNFLEERNFTQLEIFYFLRMASGIQVGRLCDEVQNYKTNFHEY